MKNVISIPTNEIMESNPIYNNTSIKNIIKNNILADYSGGIKSASINIFPSNLNNKNGDRVKTWANGDIIKVGEIINVLDKDNQTYLKDKDGNPIYFRVVDRQVSYEGQVLIDLKLQEIKKVGD